MYDSHHPSSAITRFTSLSEESIVLTSSSGQGKPLSPLQRSWDMLKNFPTFTVKPYCSLFLPQKLLPSSSLHGSVRLGVWSSVRHGAALGCLHSGAVPALAWPWPSDLGWVLYSSTSWKPGAPHPCCAASRNREQENLWQLLSVFARHL